MTISISRRRLIMSMSALGLSGLLAPSVLAQTAKAKLVVIGGGFGGATAARFAKRLLPSLSVTLVEPNANYVACPFSNLVIGGLRSIEQQTFSYGALSAEGITIVRAMARDVDAAAKIVTLDNGTTLNYDRLILSPGIDFRWDALQGYDQAASEQLPHAWKAGAQTELLRKQLQAMDDGGVVAISVTAAPFRCPPGPYERASLIAYYLKKNKPKSKLLILDSNEKFSKQGLFTTSWKNLYGDMVEWRAASNDGRVNRVEANSKTLHTDFESLKADVANIIPPQHAGVIAQRVRAASDSGWCPINATTFESTLVPNVHVIGDASIASPMPKSAFSANAQAKVCAIQIVRLLTGLDAEATTLANTCFSYVAEDKAISVSGVYSNEGGQFANMPGAGGVSPADLSISFQQQEAAQAADWFKAITGEAFS